MVASIANFPWRNWSGEQQKIVPMMYLPTNLAEVVEAVQQAESRDMQIHAFGTGWSFSDAPIGDDAMVSTNNLRRVLATRFASGSTLGPAVISQNALANGRHGLVLLEAGIKINAAYSLLMGFDAAVPTFGGAAGQSLAGVLGTASHGGDVTRRPLADWIHGLHLVGEGGRQIWIERATGGPYVDEQQLRDSPFGAGIQAIIRNDAALNAAVAACGRMGIIYSMLLETIPFFHLRESRIHVPWAVVELSARTGGLEQLRDTFRMDGRSPYFLQILRPLDSTYPFAFVTRRVTTSDQTMRPRPPAPDLALDLLLHHSDWIGILNGDQATLGNRLNGLSDADVRAIMQYVFPRFLAPQEFQGPYWYVMDGGDGALRVDSSEFGFDATATAYLDFLRELMLLARSPQIPGLFALRYSPGSQALLASTRFPMTVHVEVAAPRGYSANARFFDLVQELALEHGGIPHLGQRNELSVQQMRARYGANLLEWRRVLTRVTTRPARFTFQNAFSRQRSLEPIARDNLLLLGGS